MSSWDRTDVRRRGGRSEPLRLFRTYAEGNFIEAGSDTPFLQTGERNTGRRSSIGSPTTPGSLLSKMLVAMLRTSSASATATEIPMGDKSPKSKQREQDQKNAVKQAEASKAKQKQASQAQPVATAKGKK